MGHGACSCALAALGAQRRSGRSALPHYAVSGPSSGTFGAPRAARAVPHLAISARLWAQPQPFRGDFALSARSMPDF